VARTHVQLAPDTRVTEKPVGGSVTVTVPLVAPAPDALDTVMVYLAFCWPGLKLPRLDTAAERLGVDCPLLLVGVCWLPLLAQPPAIKLDTSAQTASVRRVRRRGSAIAETVPKGMGSLGALIV